MNNEIETLKEKLKTYTEVLLQALEMVPEDKLGWKPFDYFRSLGEQVYHIAQTENFYMLGIMENQWDFQTALKSPDEPLTKEAIKAYIDSVRESTFQSLDKMTVDDLDRVIEIPYNPTRYSVRHWLYYILEHQLHHKGQISVFLRQLDISPPFFAFAFPNNFRPDIENFKIQ